MTASTPHHESVVVAMCAALERYPWRRLTPGLFARLALAANDRHTVQLLLEGVGGTEVGGWENLEPVHLEDDRVDRLVDFLASQKWATQPLAVVCSNLHSALHA
jgi:hypothetical protein